MKQQELSTPIKKVEYWDDEAVKKKNFPHEKCIVVAEQKKNESIFLGTEQ